MKYLHSLLLTLTTLTISAQTFEWAIVPNANNSALSIYDNDKIATDNSGNLAAFFAISPSDVYDVDPGPDSLILNGAEGVLIAAKYNSLGQLIWAGNFGGYDAECRAITTDKNGNIFITGHFKDSADFDPGLGTQMRYSQGSYDIFILKLDAMGNFQWMRQFGGDKFNDYNEIGYDVTVDTNGNAIVIGTFEDTCDFDPGPGILQLAAPLMSLFVVKLDPLGSLVHACKLGSIFAGTKGTAIASDRNNNIYFVGECYGNLDLDPGPSTYFSSASNVQPFVVKLDPALNFVWGIRNATQPSSAGVRLFDIESNSSSDIYITGRFTGTTDFDPSGGVYGITASGSINAFIQRLDSLGNLKWVGNTTNESEGYSISINSKDEVYWSGRSALSADLDPTTGVAMFHGTPPGGYATFIVKMDNSNGFLWARNELGHMGLMPSLATDNFDNLYFNGNEAYDTGGPWDLDPDTSQYFIPAHDSVGYFICKWSDQLDTCSNSIGPDVQLACGPFTWIDGFTYTASTSTPTHILTNAAGCDSVVILNLTIHTVNTDVTQAGELLTANEAGANYQWLDCPGMTLISGATSQSYTATTNGDYAVIVFNNGCSDTSTCYTVAGVGIIENDFGHDLILYPNPTNGKFSIDMGDDYLVVTVTISDLNGKLIQSKKYNKSQLLNLKIEEPSGVYLLVIESGEKKAVIRLVKE